MSISDAILAEFKKEAEITRKHLQAVPEAHLSWKPHDKSMSLAQLAGHIAETPGWIHGMLQDELDFSTAAADFEPFVPESRHELLEAFEKHREGLEEALAGRDDAFLSASWTARDGDKVLMSLPRQAAIKSTVVNHVIHHRGQLTVYLRLLDVPVPQSYGPTADSQSFG